MPDIQNPKCADSNVRKEEVKSLQTGSKVNPTTRMETLPKHTGATEALKKEVQNS